MQELALSSGLLHLTAAAGVELGALVPDGIAGAATGQGKGVPPEGKPRGTAPGCFAELLQRLHWKDGGRISQLRQFQIRCRRKRVCKIHRYDLQETLHLTVQAVVKQVL
jgi:hypothetical protein